ncbi:squalene/phytoene synthase family protein [Sneathiella sp. P13V-1]|uniref:squalene/phytoene synthase family protein n=1 Tax=Sneathiella sp. P13V-1 TaxID=2697366 RepID=UPI00187B35D6|nr:squalene/phytoene synthase family protein [Sneathiella sp. P13V-1]MBE7637668.1 squalene/phytoene synthase family protein [Sneathiella sp. P13V-1]
MATENDQSLLSKEVKQYDYDRWLTCLFAPAEKREHLFALLSFNSEISRIRETVSEPLLGDIRLQWWRDALAGIDTGAVKKHPTVEALYRLHQEIPLDLALMQGMVDMRAKDLDPVPNTTDGQLIIYVDMTAGAVQRLLYRALVGCEDSKSIEAVSLAGRAYGLFGILQAIPFHGRNGLVLVPKQRMAKYGVTENSLLTKEHASSLYNIVESMTDLAASELSDARRLAKSIEGVGRTALLPNAYGPLLLGMFRKHGFDPEKIAGRLGPTRKVLALYRYRTFGF